MVKKHSSKEVVNSTESHSRLKSLLTKKNIIRTIVTLLFLIMYLQIQSIFGTFSFLQGRDSSLITEIGQIKESYIKIGQDLNEVREFLRLPISSYGGFEEEVADDDKDKNVDDVQLALFKYIDSLANNKNLEKRLNLNKSLLKDIAKSEVFLDFLEAEKLTISSEEIEGISLRVYGPDQKELISYFVNPEDGKLTLETVDQKEIVEYKDFTEFESETIKFIKENKDKFIEMAATLEAKKAEIDSALNSKEVATVADELKISIDLLPIEREGKMVYVILNQSNDSIGEIVLDLDKKEIWLVDKNDDSLTIQTNDLKTALPIFLKTLNTKTFIERKVEEALNSLKETLADDGFKLLLSENGLKIAEEPREDSARIYYDIFDDEGNQLSSIVLEKATGVINIASPSGTNPENLLFFNPDSKKKTLALPEVIPDYGNSIESKENTFNVLIAGKHGSLVDTMIFAHINEDRGTVRMISIPRDLSYNGRKINSYAFYYGMPELKKVLSQLTGYELDKYILIDMYAFIDVVDLIGGVDIHLDNAVIDPTYRTVDNGREGTLHYEAGDYHLSGVQALRLARSRHTSSDFARAERQQKIIKAIQTKATNFGFGDADTIYEIAETVLEKTETDISLDDAIAYYFRYQNYEIESNDVMSSGNILYVPPYITVENCQKLIEAAALAGEEKPDCEDENHAYTLLPRDDNWNLIKWFFRQKFEAI